VPFKENCGKRAKKQKTFDQNRRSKGDALFAAEMQDVTLRLCGNYLKPKTGDLRQVHPAFMKP